MKILCISDIHGDQKVIVKVRDYIDVGSDIDAVFMLGDYSIGFKDPTENKIDVEYAIDVLKEDAKVYALPGNCDQKSIIEIFEENKVNFHENKVELGGIGFIGLGGSNPTPFGTPFEYSEEEIYDKLVSLWGDSVKDKTVLITHFPPKDTQCDIIPDGSHAGSASLRKFIEEKQPKANVCSHIHESEGNADSIGETQIMNVGKLSHANAVIIDTFDVSLKHLTIF